MQISGQIIEIGTLEGESGEVGIVIKRPNGLSVTIKGLYRDEVRAFAPYYYQIIDLTIAADAA